jgi:sugar phosphate isomerase/epimerase
MIEFSCAEFAFPLLERRQCLALIRLLGFSLVDIGLFARSRTFSPDSLCASPASYSTMVKDDLDGADLSAADVFLQIGPDPPICAVNDPHPTVRRQNRKLFEVAVEFTQALGCHHLTGLPGVRHQGVPEKTDWGRAVEETRWRRDVCAGHGIQYAVEAHLGSICDSVESTFRFLGDAPGLTLTLDYGHFIFNDVPSSEVHRLAPHVSHMHARAGAPGRLQATFAENQIDFPGAVAALKQADFKGSIALEYVWIDWNHCNRCDNLSETILLRNHLSELVRGAKTDSTPGDGKSTDWSQPRARERTPPCV